jgi:hypothetical protein
MDTTKDLRDFEKEDTARARVLQVLVSNLGKWVRATDITAPDVGGSEGLRRLRELRAAGCQIKQELVQEGSTERKYMLIRVPDGDVLRTEKRPFRPTAREAQIAINLLVEMYRDGTGPDGKTKWKPVPPEVQKLMTWARWYFREKRSS